MKGIRPAFAAAALILLFTPRCGSDAGEDDASEPGDGIEEMPDAAADAEQDEQDAAEEEEEEEVEPLGSWIGGPCASAVDCDYEDAQCLVDAPGGMCSLECDLYCPDRDGYPMTFCVDEASLPSEAPGFVEGACFSRCDYGRFPETGCREGYGCVLAPRANDTGVEVYACIPGAETQPPTDCMEELASLGVSFEPASIAPEHPDTHPDLTCTIAEPVYVYPPIHGVDIASYYTGESGRVLAACNMALALTATADDLAAHGVVRIFHMGTYNCRVIAGTDTLSRHAYADAIDLGSFELADGTVYSLEADWEHDTDSPVSAGARFLYEAAHRWYDAWIWTIILTPNYNADHDNHFHVDLTPGSHFLEYAPGQWLTGHTICPAPYDD
jgi:hypothetical protein